MKGLVLLDKKRYANSIAAGKITRDYRVFYHDGTYVPVIPLYKNPYDLAAVLLSIDPNSVYKVALVEYTSNVTLNAASVINGNLLADYHDCAIHMHGVRFIAYTDIIGTVNVRHKEQTIYHKFILGEAVSSLLNIYEVTGYSECLTDIPASNMITLNRDRRNIHDGYLTELSRQLKREVKLYERRCG